MEKTAEIQLKHIVEDFPEFNFDFWKQYDTIDTVHVDNKADQYTLTIMCNEQNPDLFSIMYTSQNNLLPGHHYSVQNKRNMIKFLNYLKKELKL